jgi:hypothetical protein
MIFIVRFDDPRGRFSSRVFSKPAPLRATPTWTMHGKGTSVQPGADF